ncbi:hypothetical protein QMK54_17965 [Pseudomonas sp. P5_109]|uniref:hypothetical protein n=1 Tax=Pseudomonas sp. P5_109 TaxID=3043441 RepID=UPI002A360A20|nr:hypothetical protein [Pseudomonas sp. P5_109]WPN27725.1 hypothetical protein QMK54_17965 [Pseudomonas sp. P5_109]
MKAFGTSRNVVRLSFVASGKHFAMPDQSKVTLVLLCGGEPACEGGLTAGLSFVLIVYISVAAVMAAYGFALTASPFWQTPQKEPKGLAPGVRPLA